MNNNKKVSVTADLKAFVPLCSCNPLFVETRNLKRVFKLLDLADLGPLYVPTRSWVSRWYRAASTSRHSIDGGGWNDVLVAGDGDDILLGYMV